MSSKLLALMGIARGAGKVELGYDKSLESMHKFKSFVVFVACDISPKTKKGLDYASEEDDIPVYTLPYTMFDLSNAVGQKTGIISINDAGFAKKMVQLLQSEKDLIGREEE